MKKSFYTIITLTLLILSVTPIFSSSFVDARTIDQPLPLTNDTKKPWNITFNEAVASDDTNINQIYVRSADNKNIEISINLSADSKKVTVIPKKHYNLGETYTLVIPKEFKSANWQDLNEGTTMTFIIEGKYIEEVTAVAFPNFVTNVKVKGSDDVAKVLVTVNNSQIETLISNGTYYSKGFLGLMKGDQLTIQVYDQNERLLETQYSTVQ